VDVFWQYLAMFAVPRDQAIFHAVPLMDDPFAPRALAGIAGLLAIVPGIIVLRRVHSLLAFGGLWFLLILVPSSVLFVLGIGEPMAEHRAYVAAVGLFLTWGSAFGILMHRMADRGRVRVLVYAIAGLFLAQLAVQTLIRNAVWGDPVALSREAARLAPDHWMPRLLLGEAYRQTGRCEQAVLEYRAASAIRPEEEFPYTKLAGCLIAGRRLAEAETALAQLRAVNPGSDDASMGLGVLAAIGNRPEEAHRYFEETLARNPGSSQARQMLAFVEGSLPVAQHQRLCEEMRYLGQGSFEFDGCVARLRDQSASREDDGL
jgi:Flp pilus assembly protein TadD